MPIAQLNTATSRLLGSSAGITSPLAVVKELLDNALDAGASTVSVSLAPNTLDQVRVLDDGRGIPPSDLDALGRPAHTSKLRAFADLAAGRVPTLGFRGHALASINAVAAAVQVVTRTAEEPVAAKVQLGAGERFAPVCAPTGTMVTVTGLFGNMPPRRQVLLKEAKRTVVRIKEMLTAYVLANAGLRVSMKVLGEERQAWRLGQTRDRDMRQSVLEVFGAAVAANGQTHRFAGAGSEFTLVAFLPSADGDCKVLAGKGSFVSINGRPLCSTTGIGKALVGVFKTMIQQHWQRRGLAAVQKPLLLLEIACPLAEYDANVATLKDDVLFADADALLRTFGELCGMVYGTTAALGGSKVNMMSKEKDGMSTDGAAMAAVTEKLVSVQMRTACRVNMARVNSNVTDEEADFQTIEVEVPERCQVETKRSPKVTKINLYKDNNTPNAARGIERYFQPTGADFEIATDDTATPERAQAEESTQSSNIDGTAPSTFERVPLKDVPDATLNMLAGLRGSPPSHDDDDAASQQQGDGPRLSDLHGTSWSIQSLLQRRNARGGGVPMTTASASPVPQTRGGPAHHHHHGRQVAQLPMPRTPPPSDPTRGEDESRFVPASQVVDWRRQPSPASSSGSENSVPVKETRGSAPQPQQRRQVGGTRMGAGNGRYNRERGGSAAGGPGLGRRPLAAMRPGQQSGTNTAERPLARRQEYEEGRDDAATPGREGLHQGAASRGGHLGIRLVPAAALDDYETSDAESFADTPPQPKRRRADVGLINPVHSRLSTPRITYVEKSLPLESIPAGMETWRSVVTTDVGFSDVRMWMDLERRFDVYIRSGIMPWALRDVKGQEAAWLEARVRGMCRV